MQDARAVIYARYSGDKQRETSIDDQVRNCTRHADREGLIVQRIYSDKAIVPVSLP
jgi:site-specific DNA recombinase